MEELRLMEYKKKRIKDEFKAIIPQNILSALRKMHISIARGGGS